MFQALIEARRRISEGERDAAEISKAAAARITPSETLKLQYLEIVDPVTMQAIDRLSTGPVRVAGAIWVGSTRLIDNVLCNF